MHQSRTSNDESSSDWKKIPVKKLLPLAFLLVACGRGPSAVVPSSEAKDLNHSTTSELGRSEASNLNDYTPLEVLGQTYSTDGVFDVQQGTLAVWVKFLPDHSRRDHLIFSTDDSRYVLFVDTYSSSGRSILRIGARAGGNRRVVDSGYAGGNFPEASIIIDNNGNLADYGLSTPWYASVPFPEDEWHHVTMTWQGYPDGTVRIYLDETLIGEKPFDTRYDDGRPLATSLAVGARPNNWQGERIQNADGSTYSLEPSTTMQLADGGIEIQGLRLYTQAIPSEQVSQLMIGK